MLQVTCDIWFCSIFNLQCNIYSNLSSQIHSCLSKLDENRETYNGAHFIEKYDLSCTDIFLFEIMLFDYGDEKQLHCHVFRKEISSFRTRDESEESIQIKSTF